MVLRCFLMAVAVLLTAGCAGRPALQPGAHLSVPRAGELPPPTGADLIATSRPYQVGPFDELSVDVFGISELSSRQVQADASGRISLPLVGAIEAAGKTPQELEAVIEQALRGRYVRDPQVTVNLVETVSQVVTVEGQVAQPGLYPVVGRMTLLRAIATARGMTPAANQRDVVVFRTVSGQNMAALYNVDAIRRGTYSDPDIYANDVVVVGESRARRLFETILQTAPLLTTPLILLLQ
jgi:polysaccharide export outer membrane protein